MTANTKPGIPSAQVEALVRVPCKDIQKNTYYWATYDFFLYGGKRIRLVKRVAAKDIWPRQRGEAALMKADDGTQLFIHPKSYVFGNNPEPPNAAIAKASGLSAGLGGG